MIRSLVLLAAVTLAFASPASAQEWTLAAAADGHGETLTTDLGSGRSYVFECAADAVVITYTGVTGLNDLMTNTKVGDAPGSVMSDGAAMMALYTGKGEPEFQPAEFRPNPHNGWDLTLRLKPTDRTLKGLEKTDMMSLFTTGFTAAVPVETETRALFKGFLARCRG